MTQRTCISPLPAGIEFGLSSVQCLGVKVFQIHLLSTVLMVATIEPSQDMRTGSSGVV